MTSFFSKKLLTPKKQRSFVSKNTSKLPFLAQEAQTIKKLFFSSLTIRSCLRLLGKHIKKFCKS
jgi:hypothetical protein